MANLVGERELRDAWGDSFVVVDDGYYPRVEALSDLLVSLRVRLVFLTYPPC